MQINPGRKRDFIVFAYLIAAFFLLILDSNFSAAEAGNFCPGTSPCSCGTNCNGGNEVSNGYNTIDSCQDGPEHSYEYVEDITITGLNSSTIMAGDTIEIDAYVDCDPEGDEITFAYHNGTAWKAFHDVSCNTDGKEHFYKNLTLDNVQGNHTIRIAMAFAGTTGMICSYDNDAVYSDNDDLKFFARSIDGDSDAPSVRDAAPQAGIYNNTDRN